MTGGRCGKGWEKNKRVVDSLSNDIVIISNGDRFPPLIKFQCPKIK